MKKKDESILENCLFFTSNVFARTIAKIATEVFTPTGLSPTYGYLILVVNQYPGISQKELCSKLSIAPSTSTRFVNKLIKQEVLRSENKWKETHIYLTEKGNRLYEEVCHCIDELDQRYNSILGESKNEHLTTLMGELNKNLKH
ncbi:MarR family winged helix-turn-helix transcriptional regulator [Oceanobacillus sp. CF4.6]|uniref:MarR family winged helix-turn-helix transcriptional regulator n=1 Tax=Oceanobacillus sp. CF4.6 TaxID=3373080 RepID=UPI003EE61EE3